MENRIYDENNGLWYAKQGDYYLPELALPPEEEKPIGPVGIFLYQPKKHILCLFIYACKVFIQPAARQQIVGSKQIDNLLEQAKVAQKSKQRGNHFKNNKDSSCPTLQNTL